MEFLDEEHISLCEALDRTLNKGVVLWGELTLSVAGIDLIYLELRVLLAAVETLRKTSHLFAEEESKEQEIFSNGG